MCEQSNMDASCHGGTTVRPIIMTEYQTNMNDDVFYLQKCYHSSEACLEYASISRTNTFLCADISNDGSDGWEANFMKRENCFQCHRLAYNEQSKQALWLQILKDGISYNYIQNWNDWEAVCTFTLIWNPSILSMGTQPQNFWSYTNKRGIMFWILETFSAEQQNFEICNTNWTLYFSAQWCTSKRTSGFRDS